MEVSLIIQTILLILGTIVIYYIVSFYIYLRRIRTIFKGAKGPEKCHWLFGSYVHFPPAGHERVQHFIDISNKYGQDQGYVLLWGLLKTPIVVTCSPRVMGNICKSNEPKTKGLVGLYRIMEPWLGNGLLTANGEIWARNRRLLTPAFHFETLKPYTKVFNKAADTLVDKLTAKAEAGERFEVFQHVCLSTLEIIMKCAFSYSKDIQNGGENNPYVKAVNRLTDGIIYRFMHPITLFDCFWKLCTVGRQFSRDCDFVHSVAEEIIDKRRETLEESGSPAEDRRYIDFLDILLTAHDEDGRKLTRLEIRNEVDTFMFEGHDTTASALSWILYSLAENAECQRKCQAEIDGLLSGRETEDFEWSDLMKLEYLTMCIKEGMRLHSPVPVVSREIANEFDLGDRIAPKGTIIQVNIMAMNHMENIWGPDHMEFKPKRFSKENIDKIEHFQYVPFSAGSRFEKQFKMCGKLTNRLAEGRLFYPGTRPYLKQDPGGHLVRNCIGQNFAMNEQKVILSKLLRNFTFRLDPNHEVKKNMSAVMRTEDGMYMFAEKRKH